MTVALVLVAILLGPYAGTTLFVASNTLVCWIVGRRVPMDAVQAAAFADRSAGAGARLLAVLREGWFQLRIWNADLLHGLGVRNDPPRMSTGTPVLLLPGYTEGKGAMGFLGRWLSSRGFRVELQAFPSTLASIADNAAFLRTRVQAVLADSGAGSVALVGHSMGGVIARAYVHTYPDDAARVVVCFGSPQRGTILAALGIGQSSKDMSIGSDHNRRFPIERKGSVPIHSLVGMQDHIISPAWSFATLEGDNYVLCDPAGHDGPMFLREGRERLEQWLVAAGVDRVR